MNKKLLESKLRYPEIVLFWSNGKDESEIRVHHKTLKEAYNMAIEFGYRPPVWFKPWQYFTGGLGVVTIGFGELRQH